MAERFVNKIFLVVSYIIIYLQLHKTTLISKIGYSTFNSFKNYTNRRQMLRQNTPPSTIKFIFNTEDENEREKHSVYEPYWEEGDWVFSRHGTTDKYDKTRTNPYATGSDPAKPPLVTHTECNEPCLDIFDDYGPVCGKRTNKNSWKYEYKTYRSLCELQNANCVVVNKRFAWTPMRKGNCSVEFTMQPTQTQEIVDRLQLWLTTEPT